MARSIHVSRGFELIFRGRDPRDASPIAQRICGACPTAHAVASALALDGAFGIAEQVPHNGRLLRNLILGSNYIRSHLLHFYLLAALDYVDIAAAAGCEGSELESLTGRDPKEPRTVRSHAEMVDRLLFPRCEPLPD